MNLRDHDAPCEHGFFLISHQDVYDPCPGGAAIDAVDKRTVEAFLGSLTEIEAGPDEWPEYAALLVALGEYTA